MTNGPNWNYQWVNALRETITEGRLISTRGENAYERDHVTVELNMNYPVLTIPERKLNYRFMAAEAEWILRGSNRVADLIPYNSKMAAFSDDGETLYGAYGVRFVEQLDHVINTLRHDPNTRQATMTTWIPNPPKTKDVPCTIALDFKIREGRLNTHVFMRSSDLWLGLPYDVFTFSMMSCRILERLNVTPGGSAMVFSPGTLYVTAASSHLYERNLDAAKAIAVLPVPIGPKTPVPVKYYDTLTRVGLDREDDLARRLGVLKDAKRGDPARWWEV